jgi:hypothetical protein
MSKKEGQKKINRMTQDEVSDAIKRCESNGDTSSQHYSRLLAKHSAVKPSW